MNLKSLTLSLLAMSLAFAGDATDKPTKPSAADDLYNKAVAENTKDAEKAYDAYAKALDVANGKVLKGLESAKADLNDIKKFTRMSIAERAAAIAELEEKIKGVKSGAIGDGIVAKRADRGDLLGETNKSISTKDMYKVLIGKWTRSDNLIFTIDKDGTGTIGNQTTNYGKYTVNIEKNKAGNCIVTFVGSGWFMEIVSIENNTINVINEVGNTMKLTK